MSSPEEESRSIPLMLAKPKKKPRACDYCRRKKIRCDGAEMPDHRCTRCIIQEVACTYEPVNTRPPSRSYVQVLESRLQNMEKLFSQLHPNVHLPKDFNGVLESTHFQPPQENPPSISAQSSSPPRGISPLPPGSPSADSDDLDPSDDEREARLTVLDNLSSRLTAPASFATARYHGKSSHLMFLHSIIDLKQEYTGNECSRSADPAIGDRRESSHHYEGASDAPRLSPEGSAEFSHTRTTLSDPKPPYRDFPPAELMERLIDAYFVHHDAYIPILHRPTLEQGIKDGLHLRDQGFGGVLLLVCAAGSRWVGEPPVDLKSAQLPGWRWFKQVGRTRWALMERPRIEDLQTYFLMASYLGGTNTPQGAWSMIGLGLRLAQDVGVHRKKMYGSKLTVEGELWKRAFWGLVSLDRMVSFALGRPCAIHDEDFDLDLPAEVDDEVAFGNCYIKLLKILAFASRTIYSMNKLKLSLGYVGREWEQKIVADLDSALNRWVDTVPDHLRWDPNRSNRIFMNQSATLYANYYFLQICVHRPFIQSRKNSEFTFPSLAICTNAARSCIHVLDSQYQRTGIPLLLNRTPLFTAALVLLLNVWCAKRSGLTNESAMSDVHKCMYMLKRLEVHTSSARRVREVITGLISAGELPMPEDSHGVDSYTPSDALAQYSAQDVFAHTHAQPRDSTDGEALGQAPFFAPNEGQLPMALPSQQEHVPDAFMDPSFTLPVHTQDLGRLPFHYGFHPSFAQQQQADAQTQAYLASLQGQGLSASMSQGVQGLNVHTTAEGFSGDSAGFPIFAGYSELLSAFSMATPSPVTALDPHSHSHSHSLDARQLQRHNVPIATGPDGNYAYRDMDVAMSEENLAFADNMMEMWSTAPTSLGMDDWGPYLNNMREMNGDFNASQPPPSGF
ncbi:fungal-specific transcription factor domain-containing protein [Daedaleopsis nitida]|nr:fungal-specific transcription factor domain-containing protein [Daedaleopsis nitida]